MDNYKLASVGTVEMFIQELMVASSRNTVITGIMSLF